MTLNVLSKLIESTDGEVQVHRIREVATIAHWHCKTCRRQR